MPDAIQCNYRALYGADPVQTLKILQTLADLHDSLRELSKAADCHGRFLSFLEKEHAHGVDTAKNYLYLARYHLGLLHRDRNKDNAGMVTDDSMDAEGSSPEREALMSLPPGELEKGLQMMQKVMQSNAPQKEDALEDWRYVHKKLGRPSGV